jgi:hypothetical protein
MGKQTRTKVRESRQQIRKMGATILPGRAVRVDAVGEPCYQEADGCPGKHTKEAVYGAGVDGETSTYLEPSSTPVGPEARARARASDARASAVLMTSCGGVLAQFGRLG